MSKATKLTTEILVYFLYATPFFAPHLLATDLHMKERFWVTSSALLHKPLDINNLSNRISTFNLTTSVLR
jgi:hypothetical protein